MQLIRGVMRKITKGQTFNSLAAIQLQSRDLHTASVLEHLDWFSRTHRIEYIENRVLLIIRKKVIFYHLPFFSYQRSNTPRRRISQFWDSSSHIHPVQLISFIVSGGVATSCIRALNTMFGTLIFIGERHHGVSKRPQLRHNWRL